MNNDVHCLAPDFALWRKGLYKVRVSECGRWPYERSGRINGVFFWENVCAIRWEQKKYNEVTVRRNSNVMVMINK